MKHREGVRFGLCLTAMAVVLGGCASPSGEDRYRPLTSEVPAPPSFDAPPESCDAVAARFGTGLTINQKLLEEMVRRSGARTARTVPSTDTAGAQDATRLSVQVEPTGRVTGAYCG